MKYRIERNTDGNWIMVDVWKRGHAVLAEPLLNEQQHVGEVRGDVGCRSSSIGWQRSNPKVCAAFQSTDFGACALVRSIPGEGASLPVEILVDLFFPQHVLSSDRTGSEELAVVAGDG